MILLRTLGAIDLTASDGRTLDELLAQPKRLAVLAYLAAPAPGTWHRRDLLTSVFWPELDQGKARTALRNGLYILRRHLGTDVIRTRGDEDVALDPALLTTDAAEFCHEVQAGRQAEALARYRGPYLPGLFVRGSEGFEAWLERERQELAARATRVARELSLACEAAGNGEGAAEAQARLVELQPSDEAAVRRLMTLHERAGNRGRALAAYEQLAAHLRAELDAEPSAETLRQAEHLRTRRPPPAPDPAPPPAPAPATAIAAAVPTGGAAPAPRRMAARWWAVATLGLVVLVTAVRYQAEAAPGPPLPQVLLPLRNLSGDSASDYLARGLGDALARRLSVVPGLTLRHTWRGDWPQAAEDSLPLLATAFTATRALEGQLFRDGDSLRVRVEEVDLTTGERVEVATAALGPLGVDDAASQLAAGVVGHLLRRPLPEDPRPASGPVAPEAYRLTLSGWNRLMGPEDQSEARDLFLRATQADPSYARAWSGLSSAWSAAAVNGRVPWPEGAARAEAAARRALALDSLEGTAWANLGLLITLSQRSLAAGAPYFERALQAEPGNPEIHMVRGTLLRYARTWDEARDAERTARALDPLSAFYAEREANTALCRGRAAEALPLYQAQVELNPRLRSGLLGVARSLARLGRWDEAIAELRTLARSMGDTATATSLPGARGADGYWALKHREGEALLERRLRAAERGWVAPYLIAVAQVGAGQIEEGMAGLEAEVAAGSRMVYKLPCNPEIDEVRDTPRFQRLLERAGGLPLGSRPATASR